MSQPMICLPVRRGEEATLSLFYHCDTDGLVGANVYLIKGPKAPYPTARCVIPAFYSDGGRKIDSPGVYGKLPERIVARAGHDIPLGVRVSVAEDVTPGYYEFSCNFILRDSTPYTLRFVVRVLDTSCGCVGGSLADRSEQTVYGRHWR